MGLRLIIFLAVVWIALFLIRSYLRGKSTEKKPKKRNIDTVRCAHCDLVLPMNQAIKKDNLYFCSEKHLKAGPHD